MQSSGQMSYKDRMRSSTNPSSRGHSPPSNILDEDERWNAEIWKHENYIASIMALNFRIVYCGQCLKMYDRKLHGPHCKTLMALKRTLCSKSVTYDCKYNTILDATDVKQHFNLQEIMFSCTKFVFVSAHDHISVFVQPSEYVMFWFLCQIHLAFNISCLRFSYSEWQMVIVLVGELR